MKYLLVLGNIIGAVVKKNASVERKELFIHEKVKEVLEDFPPFWNLLDFCSHSDPHLIDHS